MLANTTRYEKARHIVLALLLAMAVAWIAPVGAQDSVVERNRAAYMRVIEEAFNAGDLSVLPDIFAPAFVVHSPNGDLNRDGAIGTIGALKAAMPDLTLTPLVVVAESNFVSGLVVAQGTFENPLWTPNGEIPPTGQPVVFTLTSIHRFNEQGQSVEEWLVWDNLSFLGQLEALPGAPAPANDPESVIRRFYAFYHAGDTDSQDGLWAEDATLTLANGTTLIGRENVITFRPTHDQIEVVDLVVDGNSVSWTSVIGGDSFELEAIVEDGLITSMRFR